MGRVLVGTSGWVYPHWRRIFYPEGVPARLWLAYYSTIFATVELNNTFYMLPPHDAVERWREDTPEGFVFACKGSRFLTHMKRLTDHETGLDRYFDRVDRLGIKQGPILWQLPPQMSRPDPGRLDAFLAAQPEGTRQVFEFRHAGWYVPEVLAVLDKHGCALCEHDLVDEAIPRPTGSFRYLRFHGKTGKYRGRYGAERLRRVARELRDWGGEAYVYFNNDGHGHAVWDALELIAALGDEAYVLDHGSQTSEKAREERTRASAARRGAGSGGGRSGEADGRALPRRGGGRRAGRLTVSGGKQGRRAGTRSP
jgi:uncharacterized protein YecE (DUF72 family)